MLNETAEKEQINKAYNWLSNSVRGNFSSMTTEDISFGLLALAYDDNLASEARDALLNNSESQECWPSSCRVKDTALAVLALSRIGIDTSKAEEWLMAQNGTPVDLVWFMQVDANEAANCSISYDSLNYNVTLNTKKKLNKGAGTCLMLSYGNYWFKISSACYDKTFTINCDKDFVTSLFYQKPGSTTIYVSSDTKRESANTDVDLRISSVCLKQDGGCNYEATSWAALALTKNRDVSVFMPYLVGYSDNNNRLMPNAFLFALTGQEDYANALLSSQRKAGYWQADSTAYNKYYDTALAMLALQEYTSEKKTLTKTWLLNEQVTNGGTEGSWEGNKRDTSFLLYAIWPKEASYIPPTTELKCEDYGYYCEQSYDCDFDNRLTDYTCQSLQVCCKQKYEEKTRSCNEMGGVLCDASLGYRCEGSTESSTDGTCCMGYCTKEQANECENKGYVCRDSCLTGEEDNGLVCPSNQVCCQESAVQPKKKGMGWIWFLVIFLLMAGIVAFLFRDKIRDNLKRKPRFTPTGLTSARTFPRFTPPAPPARQLQPPARMQQQAPPTVPLRNRFFSLKKSQTDKDLDETLKKLKDISEK